MEPRFVEKGPLHLVGIVKFGKLDEIVPNLNDIWMNQFMKYDEQLKPYSVDKAYYGAWIGDPSGNATYVAGMAVEDLSEVPAGLGERTLPAARYAVFPCTVSTIGQTYDQVYSQWLPASMYEYDSMAADFEYYPPNTETGDSFTEIYIPIKVKQPQEV